MQPRPCHASQDLSALFLISRVHFPDIVLRDFQPGVLLKLFYSCLPCVLAKTFIPSRQQFKTDLLKVRRLVVSCCVLATRIKEKNQTTVVGGLFVCSFLIYQFVLFYTSVDDKPIPP